MEDTVDVEQNRGHGRRVYSRDEIGRSAAERDRAPLFAVKRSGRAARPEIGDPGGGSLRRRSVHCLEREPEATCRRPGGPDVARGRPGRTQPAAEPGARCRATRRTAPARTEGRAGSRRHEAARYVTRAPTRAETPARRDEAPSA